MDGLSGIKIYNELVFDTSFLPPGYSTTLDFIVTGVDHKIQGGDWETTINTTLIPRTSPIDNIITSSISFTAQSEEAQLDTPPSTAPTFTPSTPPKVEGAWEVWNKNIFISSAYELNAHHSEPIDEIDPKNTRSGGWTKSKSGKYIYDISLFRKENGIRQTKPFVPSPVNGTVIRTAPDSSGNSYLTIKGNDGLEYDLLHMDSYLVKVGDTVTKGKLVARQSNVSPPAYANHLHIQMPTKQALIDYIYNLVNNSF
jgi:biotin carboxyl carrier protein